ncbi:hypothetical protein [Carboxydocella sp. ULO1]|nr:hypothetical protein [Carboxydocella sp. ULO1]GAW28554.1 hypothetical protein ULO1_11240 [Carboxydocella sp. ULO1]
METIERTNILLEEILAEIRKITNYINLLEQRRVEAEKKVISLKDYQASN